MYLIHYYVGLPVGFLYSLIISYLLLGYFQNKEKTNMLLFCIGVLHLSFLFLMPIMCLTIVLLPLEGIFFQYNEKSYSYIIEIITYVNHALNKLIYPIIKVYCQSGYISAKYKFRSLSFCDWLLEFFDLWYFIIVFIVTAILKLISEKYANALEYILDYLNLLDLIKVYIEICYSVGNITLFYSKIYRPKEDYKYFIIGKISIYGRKKKESLKKHFKKLCQLNLTYIKNNSKFSSLSEIPTFIDKVKSKKYFQLEELGLVEPEILDENMTIKKLEDLISEPYEKCKKNSRKLDRMKNIRKDVLGQREQRQNESCIYKLLKCCKCCINEKCLFVILVITLVLMIIDDIAAHISYYKEVNIDGYCNTTSVGEIGQDGELPNVFLEIICCIIAYPIIYFALIIATGVYVIPLLYALINRIPITGDFIYAKNSSDTIDLIESLGNITEKVFPSLYLSSVFYGMIYYSSTSNEENIAFDLDCLTFFNIPKFKLFLYYKYIPIIISIGFTRYLEKIKLKCLKCIKCISHTINISDECYFDASCYIKKSCFENERMYYIEEGRKEMENISKKVPIMNNNNMNNIIMNNIAVYNNNYYIDSGNNIYNNNNNNIIYNNQI